VEEEFNYDEYAAREFGSKRNTPRGIKPFWRWVALGLLIAFGVMVARAFLR
jgi:hypothetical protein